ncbi:hypothetical protein K6U06_23455 [Acidiferrimicrobium sp. IK]|uniref:hypothetical protein n=1 Tax=Acidiferrimicrobium sp. IK TaxID=2871700 RepID=UPI0021CAF8FB|nr:hypothetical protein [Acidiferrimicrobium sp. IK]MCU4187339.1 hypothetical protein [Acidiferrimicrobium sp. IK]
METKVFDDLARTDATPARHNEGRFAFLNRSASQYFQEVRDLIEDWFAHLPQPAKKDLRGALRADDRQMESAFWELFLHEAYRCSGYEIEIHPDVPGRPTRPDFRMTRDEERFYIEAVSVGQAATAIGEDRRLQDLHQILADLQVQDFSLELSTYTIGPKPLATRGLRRELQDWLAGLDPDEVARSVEARTAVGFDALPAFAREDEGWRLEFHALPLRDEVRGRPRSALGMLGPGEAVVVDNVTGIRRALDSKKSKYGQLDAPLVVAVLSNTMYPTKDYEFEQALYGVSSYRPHESPRRPDSLFQEGFWLTKAGWRYGNVPQVVSAAGLSPWTVTTIRPRLWTTLEPGATATQQPDWLARLDLTVEARPLPSTAMGPCFGLPPDWPGMAEPDFDLG